MSKEDRRTETCAADLEEHRGICLEHSGVASKLNGGLALLTVIMCLIGYQVFFQVPDLKYANGERLTKIEGKLEGLEKTIQAHQSRMDMLERYHNPGPVATK